MKTDLNKTVKKKIIATVLQKFRGAKVLFPAIPYDYLSDWWLAAGYSAHKVFRKQVESSLQSEFWLTVTFINLESLNVNQNKSQIFFTYTRTRRILSNNGDGCAHVENNQTIVY